MTFIDVFVPILVVCTACGILHIIIRKRNKMQNSVSDKYKKITGVIALAYFAGVSVMLLSPLGPGQAAQPRLLPFQTISSMLSDCIKNGIINTDAVESIKTSWINIFYIFSHSARNLLANVLFFIPMGLLMALHIKSIKFSHAAIVSLCIPLFVEIWQVALAKGRTFDVDDIILNFAGIFIGFTLVIIFRKNRRKNDKRNNRRNKQKCNQ